MESKSKIRALCLGAGQDVGRSCIYVEVGGKRVLLDVGFHMGQEDEKKFPDFKLITKDLKEISNKIDVVIVTHFHLDHCGALPYLTEALGYSGPIYMTHPTKAICPVLLHDYRKLTTNSRVPHLEYTQNDVDNCISKVIGIGLHETIEISPGFTIKAYYAGHVLGAGMFLIKVNGQSVLYTGDYNMTADRHLGAAKCDRCEPDLMISESTYATMIRDSRRVRERNFLKKVHETVEKGGKVLIPVFALGRAQEIMILLEAYWDRLNLKVPIYFSGGISQKANEFFRFFINWCNESVQDTFLKKNVFDFPHVKPRPDGNVIHSTGPMVLLATPGMLHAGYSLSVFQKWCSDKKNLIVLPGYCLPKTVGGKLLAGDTEVAICGKVHEVKMQVSNISFSAHADSKGIMRLIKDVGPKQVMFVHGELRKMENLSKKIQGEMGICCSYPANGQWVQFDPWNRIPTKVSTRLMKTIKATRLKRKRVNEFLNRDNTKKRQKLQDSDTMPFAAAMTLSKQKSQLEYRLESKRKASFQSGRAISFETHLCNMPLQLQVDLPQTLQYLHSMLERNLCSEYRAVLEKDRIDVTHDRSSKPVSVRITDVELKSAKNLHTKVTVNISYTEEEIDTAVLCQSIIFMTCDSYC